MPTGAVRTPFSGAMRTKHWVGMLALCAALAAALVASQRNAERGARATEGEASAPAASATELFPADGARPAGGDRSAAAAEPRVAPAPALLLVRGQVVDETGAPVPGAEISAGAARHRPNERNLVLALEARPDRPGLAFAPLERALTGADGAFELRVAPTKDLYVAVRATGRVGVDLVRAAEEGELDLGSLALATAVNAPCRVVDESGRPIAGAEVLRTGWKPLDDDVNIEWREALLATSAADGTFVLDGLPLGRTPLEVRAPGFVPMRGELSVDALQMPERTIVLAPAAHITGRVVGAPAGLDVEVSYWCYGEKQSEWSHVACAPDGAFVIDGLRRDPQMVALHALARTATAEREISPGLQAQPGDAGLELRVPAPTTWRLCVTDAKTGAPLADAHVVLLEGWATNEEERAIPAPDGAAGCFSLSLLLPEQDSYIALSIAHDGYEGVALGALPFAPGETRDLGVVALEPLETTLLRVVDATTHAPAAGARVHVELAPPEEEEWNDLPKEWPAHTTFPALFDGVTDADGRVRAPLSSGQRYVASAEHADHARREVRFETSPRPPAELEIALSGGGALVVRCVDARTGAPVEGARVDAYPDDWRGRTDDPSHERRTGPDGRARYEHLAPGRHRIWASDLDDEVHVNVAADEEREVELRLAVQRVRLRGRVTEHGVPLAGAMVACGGYDTATGLDGSYVLAGLYPGDEELEITHPKLGPLDARSIELIAPVTHVDVDLTPVALAGTVRDESGAALEGATVWLGQRGYDGALEGLYSSSANAFLHLTTSGPDGRFRFEGVQPRDGLWLVCQRAGSCAARIGPLAFPPDGSALELAPVLRRAAELEVVVEGLDPQSFLLGQVVARWRGTEELAPDEREQKGEGVKNTLESTSLRFRFDTLPPGAWRIEVRDFLALDEGEPRAVSDVELHAGANETLVIRP